MKGTTLYLYSVLERLHGSKRVSKEKLIRQAAEHLWAFAVSGAPAFLGSRPFGVALLCRTRSPASVCVALCLGAAARGLPLLIPVYLSLLCFRLITLMWVGEESRRVNALLCVLGMGLYALFEILSLQNATSLLRGGIGLASASALYLCATPALNSEAERHAFTLASVYTAACAATGITLYGIGIGNLLGFIVCLNLARYAGSTMGCAAGALWGLGSAPEYAPAFAVSALIGGRATSPLTAVGGAAVFCMLFASFTGGYHGIRDFLPDITVAAVLFLPLSKLKFMNWDFLAERNKEPENEAKAPEKEKRLAAIASALGSLSAIFYGMSDRMRTRDGYESATDMTGVFADDYAAMSELISSALHEDEEENDRITAGKVYGMLRMSRIKPRSVSATSGRVRHIRIEGLPKSVMGEAQLLKTRISNLLGEPFCEPAFTVSETGVRAELHTAPTLHAEWSSACKTKQGETVSGDSLTAFTTEDGHFYCVLCDGMGSGADAAIASRTCCVFLQKMLECGADSALSVKMLNTFLRSKGYECFATVDIFSLDLYTGEAFFIKGGSAPSHLFRAGCEYTMASATAPVGIIREVYAERIAFDAMPGDRIVMKSDGAETDVPPKPPSAKSASAAAKELLTKAISCGHSDDVTVCVINIEGV